MSIFDDIGDVVDHITRPIAKVVGGVGEVMVSGGTIILGGPVAYNGAVNWMRRDKDIPGQNLIHELTRVWQGKRNVFGWTYVFSSIANQCSCCVQNQSTDRAYWYVAGKHFQLQPPPQPPPPPPSLPPASLPPPSLLP